MLPDRTTTAVICHFKVWANPPEADTSTREPAEHQGEVISAHNTGSGLRQRRAAAGSTLLLHQAANGRGNRAPSQCALNAGVAFEPPYCITSLCAASGKNDRAEALKTRLVTVGKGQAGILLEPHG